MTLFGYDIASYQATLDPRIVPGDFVFVKVTEGNGYVNPTWKRQAQQVLDSGKLLGLYHFANPTTNSDDEANFFWNNAKAFAGRFIPVLDWEASATKYGVVYAKAFLDKVAQLSGASPIIYMGKGDTRAFNWSSVAGTYGLWAAQYGSYNPMGYTTDYWTDNGGYGAWDNHGGPMIQQYTSSGRISNYSGNIDLNVAYISKDAWKKMATGNGTVKPATPKPTKPANGGTKQKYAEFKDVYVLDEWVSYNGKWYVINYDMSLKPIDYNNWIPASKITLTDRYGKKLASQVGQGNNGNTEFFVFDDEKLPISSLSGGMMKVTIAGEPVWLESKYAKIV